MRSAGALADAVQEADVCSLLEQRREEEEEEGRSTIVAQIWKLTAIVLVIHVASLRLVCGFPALAFAVDPGHLVRRSMQSVRSWVANNRESIACFVEAAVESMASL